MQPDFLRYYDLETYLWEDVHRRFHVDGGIGAFDFFSIVVWKANRAKSKVAKKLLQTDPKGRTELEPIVRDLTGGLHDASAAKDRLHILMKGWGFYLPMASSILSVLWPDDFSVYDVRVCGQLGCFHKLGNKTDFDRIWTGYHEYLEAVRCAVPSGLSLRDADRFLWGRSVWQQLAQDVERGFLQT